MNPVVSFRHVSQSGIYQFEPGHENVTLINNVNVTNETSVELGRKSTTG